MDLCRYPITLHDFSLLGGVVKMFQNSLMKHVTSSEKISLAFIGMLSCHLSS